MGADEGRSRTRRVPLLAERLSGIPWREKTLGMGERRMAETCRIPCVEIPNHKQRKN